MAETTTQIVGNLYMNEIQLANALAGMAGIDVIASGETWAGSYCKICGIEMKCTIDQVEIDFSAAPNTFVQLPIYAANITNNADTNEIYAYRTGLSECTKIK